MNSVINPSVSNLCNATIFFLVADINPSLKSTYDKCQKLVVADPIAITSLCYQVIVGVKFMVPLVIANHAIVKSVKAVLCERVHNLLGQHSKMPTGIFTLGAYSVVPLKGTEKSL